MHQLYQTVPTGAFKQNPAKTFKIAESGPVVVMSRSKPVAVMISPEEWDKTAKQITELQEQLERERRLRLSNQRYATYLADSSHGVDQEQYEQGLANMGLES